jgi:hypothetical protein
LKGDSARSARNISNKIHNPLWNRTKNRKLSTGFAITRISKIPGYIGIGNKAPGGPPDHHTPDTQSPNIKRDAEYIHKK